MSLTYYKTFEESLKAITNSTMNDLSSSIDCLLGEGGGQTEMKDCFVLSLDFIVVWQNIQVEKFKRISKDVLNNMKSYNFFLRSHGDMAGGN